MLDFPDSMWLESLEGNHHFNIFQWTFEGLWGLKKSQAFSCSIPMPEIPAERCFRARHNPGPCRHPGASRRVSAATSHEALDDSRAILSIFKLHVMKRRFLNQFPRPKASMDLFALFGEHCHCSHKPWVFEKEKIPNQILLIWAETWRDFQDFLAINNIMYIW